jgi:hypothetical protein
MVAFNCFGLPEALRRDVFVEWLGLKQVVWLDSAFCCRASRVQFTSLIYGQLTTFAVNFRPSYRRVNSALRWVTSRGIRLDAICLCGDTIRTEESLQLLEMFLAVSGSAILRVRSCTCSRTVNIVHHKVLLLVAKWCSNMVSFQAEHFGATWQWDDSLIALTKACQRLTKLSLDGVMLSDQGLAEALRHCVALENLEVMTSCKAIPIEVAIPSLITMTFSGRYLSDAVLLTIGRRCARLETLIVFGLTSYSQVTDVGVRAVLQGCPLLRETDVEYATGISGVLRVELVRRLSPSCLDFGHWSGIDNHLVQGFLMVCPNLTTLWCRRCEWLTDATLAVCAQHCRQLQRLGLDECPHVTTDGLRALVINLGSTLRSIDLCFSDHLGDEVVLAIAEHCPLLEQFTAPPNTSDTAMAELLNRCVNLKLKAPRQQNDDIETPPL